MGKIKAEGEGEVQEMIDIADFAVGQSRMLYGRTMHSERPGHRMYEQWHPLGLVGIISAFNFPVAVWSWNALIAAIAGNVSIWKPSPKTPLCASRCRSICAEVMDKHGYPPIFQTFIDGDNSLAGRFVDDERVEMISFTGSTPSVATSARAWPSEWGAACWNSAATTPSSSIDADLELAIPAVVFGAVGTAGQRCTTTRRLFVHRIAGAAGQSSSCASAYAQVRIGDPLDPNTLMGPLIDAASVRALPGGSVTRARTRR
jgi:aldehyde dehydrogenase (NAD+)